MLPDGAEPDVFFLCFFCLFCFFSGMVNDLTVSQEVQALVAKARYAAGDKKVVTCC